MVVSRILIKMSWVQISPGARLLTRSVISYYNGVSLIRFFQEVQLYMWWKKALNRKMDAIWDDAGSISIKWVKKSLCDVATNPLFHWLIFFLGPDFLRVWNQWDCWKNMRDTRAIQALKTLWKVDPLKSPSSVPCLKPLPWLTLLGCQVKDASQSNKLRFG